MTTKGITKVQRHWMNEGAQREREAMRTHLESVIRRENVKAPFGAGLAALLKIEEWVSKRAARTAAKRGGLGRK